MAKVGRPRKTEEEKVQNKILFIDKDIHDMLKVKAERKGVNMKTFVAGLISAA